MTKEQIEHLFSKHAKEDLVFISLNNNRRIHVDDTNRDLISFDHTLELMTYEQPNTVLHEMRNYHPFHATLYQGYDMIEVLMFKRP